MVKIDNAFFEDKRVMALTAEFGAAGVYVLLKLMCRLFESPEGYWMHWDLATRTLLASDCKITLSELEEIMERMGHYNLINWHRMRNLGILSSRFLQREFIRHCGAARASRTNWDEHRDLPLDELTELGVIIPQSADKVDIAVGEVGELPEEVAAPLRAVYQRQRVRSKDQSMAYFRRVKRSRTQQSDYKGPLLT